MSAADRDARGSAADRVRVSTLVAVDPETAFDVFTGEIGLWWRKGKDLGTGRKPRRGVMRFEPGVGGRLLEVYDERGGEQFEIGRVRVWEPGSRLVLQWRQGNFEPDQETEVEVRFQPEAEGTRVTLEHRGLASLPPDHSARHGLGTGVAFARMMEQWWQGILAELRARTDHTRKGNTRRANTRSGDVG